MRELSRGVLTLLLLVGGSAALAAGSIENSEVPADGDLVYEMREAWRLGGAEDDEVMFGVVAELVPGADGNLYVLDSQLAEVLVVTPDGEVLRTIGRAGEGPGEFQNGSDLFWSPDGALGVVQSWPGKIVMIHPDGTPGRPYKLPFRDGTGFQAASRGQGQAERIVLSGTAWTNEDGQQYQISYLKAYGLEGQEVAHYAETQRETAFGGWAFQEEHWVDFQRRWTAAADGRVAAALAYRDYEIQIWQADGTPDVVIKRPGHRLVRRNGDETKGFQAMYDRFTSWNPNSTFDVSEVHQAVEHMLFRPDGTLWVQDGAARWRAPTGTVTSYDVYDRGGVFTRRVHLKGDADAVRDGIFLVGDRVYVVTDLLGALMASAGVEGDLGGDDPEPVAVVAYDLVEVATP